MSSSHNRRPVMVGGAVAHPAATPEPDVYFHLIRLFSTWVFVIDTICRVLGRRSGRGAAPGW
jgi:hypothetical protein